GSRPCVVAVEVTPIEVPTVFILGDSTVCDQPLEPYASWGQMLPRFFKPQIAVANHAESGESLRSSLSAHRVEKVLESIRKGDFLLIQYGHNDMKAVDEATYQASLRNVAALAREKGATVILITPMHRRRFQGDSIQNSLKGFPDAVRQLAKEQRYPLIDLHAMSETLYEALGPDGSGILFKAGDGTHHNNYGAYELARCVVDGIRRNESVLADFLKEDLPPFDPAHPDPVETFQVPASPRQTTVPPEGQ
ncbi:MAG TPA: rhamnogalacturonan acetylesterase, partial [Isosphaeraceae bacterium]|nr:rhamnogalacturonan acetylesterase [Isosphaeraceae bacterium]